ncbi:MAG: adenylate/guanylate cyclase domain-containing protein [Acidimicrobiia bacterium]
MPSTVRYARSGDVHIAYGVVGDGPFDVVFVPGFVSNVEWYMEHPMLRQLADRFASFCRFILWDKRGTGMSDPVTQVPTLDDRADDLAAVMDAVGSPKAALFGVSEGGPMAILYAASRPERVSALALYGTTPKFVTAPEWPWGWSPEGFQGLIDEVEAAWAEGALLDFFAPSLAANEAAREAWGRLLRSCASPAMARAVLQAAAGIDCRHILEAVRVPTLVQHRTGDRVCHVEAARRLAEAIPGAVFIEYPGDDHIISLGDSGPVFDDVEQFLTGARPAPNLERVLATVLFTDLVESTAHATRMGDLAWRRFLESHHSVVRHELDRFGGREVKTLGDGFLATFAGPSRAIAAACAIRDGVGRLGVDIRAGVHTGECEVMGDDVAGVAVHTAARVAGLAAPREVLVSSTVKDLVAGSGLSFADRGSHQLKGVPGPWRLFTVS